MTGSCCFAPAPVAGAANGFARCRSTCVSGERELCHAGDSFCSCTADVIGDRYTGCK